MAVTEIVSDKCYFGWPAFTARGANRHVSYLYVRKADEVVIDEKSDGTTQIEVNGSVTWYPPSLEPVIVRRTK